MAYDLDQESFVLEFFKIPAQTDLFNISQSMLIETRKIEKNLVSKLNCMYFAARKVSIPSVAYMIQKEKQESTEGSYFETSQKLNALINKYFKAERGGKYSFYKLITDFR